MALSLAQLMANNTPQPWTRGAARSIFDLFAGHEPAKQAGYTQGLRLASLLEGARRKRDENLGFSQITPDLVTQALGGDKQAAATLASAAAHGGVPIRQFSQYGLDQDQLRALAHLKDAFSGIGDTGPQADLSSALIRANGGANINNDLMGAMRAQVPLAGTAAVPQAESPLLHAMGLDTTGQSGGVLYDKFAAPGAQTAVATPVGAAQAKANRGRFDAAEALADQRSRAPTTAAAKQPTPWNASGKDVATMAAMYSGSPAAGDSASFFGNTASDDPAEVAKRAAEQAAAQTAVYRILAAHPEIHSVAQFVEYLHQTVGSPVNPIPTAGTMSLPAAFGASPGVGDGTASPAAAPAPAAPRIAVNPQTGAKVVWNDSAWVPYDG